jgi:hypothetical protein
MQFYLQRAPAITNVDALLNISYEILEIAPKGRLEVGWKRPEKLAQPQPYFHNGTIVEI